MFEVLLLDIFNVYLGPSSGLEIVILKRFQEKLTEFNRHNPKCQKSPLIAVLDDLKTFFMNHLQMFAKYSPRDDTEN